MPMHLSLEMSLWSILSGNGQFLPMWMILPTTDVEVSDNTFNSFNLDHLLMELGLK